MPYSIMLDAGHGGADPGAVYEGRQEKDDNLKLAMAVGKILADNGIDVLYTRTTDVYQTPFEKTRLANINSDTDNQIFDDKFHEIAEAIAEAITGTLDEETVESPLYYRVQVGAFRNRENADRLVYQLTDKGFPAFLLYEDGLYKVQVGAFMQLGNAIRMEQRLRDAGYSTVIVTK